MVLSHSILPVDGQCNMTQRSKVEMEVSEGRVLNLLLTFIFILKA